MWDEANEALVLFVQPVQSSPDSTNGLLRAKSESDSSAETWWYKLSKPDTGPQMRLKGTDLCYHCKISWQSGIFVIPKCQRLQIMFLPNSPSRTTR